MRAYILPMLGKYEIAEITEDVLQNCTFQWQEMPSNDGKPRKNSVIQNWIVLVKQTLNYAVRKEYLAQFKVHIYIAPNKKRNIDLQDEYIFSYVEQQKILDYARRNPTPQVVGIALCLSSGLRIGEICALQWKIRWFILPKRCNVYIIRKAYRTRKWLSHRPSHFPPIAWFRFLTIFFSCCNR